MIRALTSFINDWRRYRVSVRELSRLTDRELHDLGIGRADIVRVARQGSLPDAA